MVERQCNHKENVSLILHRILLSLEEYVTMSTLVLMYHIIFLECI